MSRSTVFLMATLVFATVHAASLEEIHLIQPHPRGKADSVLALRERLVFIPGSELQALEEAARSTTPALPSPPVAGTVSSLAIEGTVTGDIVRLAATYVIDVLEQGAVYVPLVARSVPILSVREGAAPVSITAAGPVAARHEGTGESTGAWWGVILDGVGRRTVEAVFPVPVNRTEDGGSFQLSLPTVAAAEVRIGLPPGEWDVECGPGSFLRRGPKGTSIELLPGTGGTISLAWRQAARRIVRPRETREVTLEATGEHVVSVGEAAVKGHVQFNLRVWTGQVQVLDITKPEGADVMNVSGPSVETWDQNATGIRVYLGSPVQGDDRLVLEYLITLPGPEGAVSLPSFAIAGARRQLMYWAVVATTSIQVELAQTQGVEVLQPRELPETLKGFASGRILAALRGDPTTAEVVLAISRHTDVPVLVASVDQARLSTVIYGAGHQVTTCRYDIRNTTKQFLELSLPPGAQLWDVRVDRMPVRPGLVDGTVLVPLASSLGRSEETSFPVELTYLVPMRLAALAGKMLVEGPRPDLPASRVSWDIRYPGRLHPLRWGGNMEREAAGASPRGRVSLRDVLAPQAPMAPAKEDLERGADELLQLRQEASPGLEGSTTQTGEDYKSRLGRDSSLQIRGGRGKTARRTTGTPSVEVATPEVGAKVRFTQILQQSQAPAVHCVYVKSGIRWERVGIVVAGVALLIVLARWRRRHAAAAVLVLALNAEAAQAPREILRLVPEDELARLLTGPAAQEMAYVPYTRIATLLSAIRTGKAVAAPAMSFLDKVELALDLVDDDLHVVGSASMVSVGKGWRAVDLVGSGARVVRVTMGGSPAPLWSTAQGVKVLAEGEGLKQIQFEYYTTVSIQGNSRSATCPLPSSMGALLTISLPPGSSGLTVGGRKVELEAGARAQTATVPVAGQRDVGLTWRYVSPELILPGAVRQGAAEPTARGRLMVETVTLYSVDAGAVEGRTRVTADIVQGSRDSLVFVLQPGMEVLDVASSAVTDWAVKHTEQRRLIVLLKNGSKGRVTVQITHAMVLPDTVSAVTIREPAVQDAVRFRGQAGVQVLTSVRVTPVSQTASTRTDPRDLPQELWAMATNPILLAYKHIDPSYALELRVEQQRDIPLLIASVDRAQLLSVISTSGRAVSRARLFVRNSGEQFLRVVLPEDARVWSYSVDGTTSAPSRGDDGALRLPVPPSPEEDDGLRAVQVELVWGQDLGPRPYGGPVSLVGPRMEIPCSVVEWDVYVPTRRTWLVTSSNLDRAPWPEAWRADKAAARGDRLMAQLNIAEEMQNIPSDGWAGGAMPVKVDIPLEGRRLTFSRAMLIGASPAVALWAIPVVPRAAGVAAVALVLLVVWRLSARMRVRGFIVRVVLTAAAMLFVDRLLGAAAVAGLLWRWIATRPRRASLSDTTE